MIIPTCEEILKLAPKYDIIPICREVYADVITPCSAVSPGRANGSFFWKALREEKNGGAIPFWDMIPLCA